MAAEETHPYLPIYAVVKLVGGEPKEFNADDKGTIRHHNTKQKAQAIADKLNSQQRLEFATDMVKYVAVVWNVRFKVL